MKIIDTKTGSRISNEDKEHLKKLAKDDPLERNANKDLEVDEHSPMDPPDAYDKKGDAPEISYEDMPKALQLLMDDHREISEVIEEFEKAVIAFKDDGFRLDNEINEVFSKFFHHFDHHLLEHNRREERYLFPLLHRSFIENGEHGTGENPSTAVDLMEDDHIQFIQLGTLTFNMLGLAARLPDDRSKAITYDLAWNNAMELIEMVKLHIYREDNTLFPLATTVIDEEGMKRIEQQLRAETSKK